VGKWERRKGFDILLRCFDEVFGGSREVELVVHCGAEPDDAARQRALNVRFSAERSRSEMPPLYQSADCFVLTTRAEAWGLPISEAMSCGVPPIVTDYSGPTEFVHEGVGYPVRVRGMSFLKDPVFYPTAWHRLPSFGRWAEPDPAHVRARLRQAVDEPDGLRARGVAARLEMVERWTWQRAGERARQCLDEHRGLHGKRSHTE
jgi:glycosyltransferase involved in cell wall biosynthesis